MDPLNRPVWMLWMALGLLLAAVGGIPLLDGSRAADPEVHMRNIAKLVVGALIVAYAVWLRRKAWRH